VQRDARLDEKSERVEQRDDDGPHACRLSENARNLNRRNTYEVLGSLQSGTPATDAHIGPLAGHQLAMPSKNGVGRHDGRDLSEHPTSKPMPQFGEAAALAVIQAQSSSFEPCLEDTVLFA
jgi:hypothetical protein